MKEMEIVIQIPQRWFDDMVREEFSEVDELCAIIQHGTVLPEKHGRLGDLDALEEEMIGGINAGLMMGGYDDYANINDTEDCLECVRYADTIIKASGDAFQKGQPNRDDEYDR